MACLAIAMDALPLHAPFHYRNPEYVCVCPPLLYRNPDRVCALFQSRSFTLSKVHGHVTRKRRSSTAVVCEFAGHGKSGMCEEGGQGQGQEQEQQKQQQTAALSKHREERKKSFRLRGRLRLALRSLRRWSPSVILRAFVLYSRAHSKQVALSTFFGCTIAMGCLCLKLTSIPAPHFVPYSDFVNYLHSGTVITALFEEGSRQVFFNVKPADNDDTSTHSPSTLRGLGMDDDIILHNDKSGTTSNIESEALKSAATLGRTASLKGALDEDMAKHLRIDVTALEAAIDEDMTEAKVAGSAISALSITGMDSDIAKQEDIDMTIRRQSPALALSTSSKTTMDDGMAKQGHIEASVRRVPAASAAVSAFSSSLRAITGAPEQLLKTRSHPWQYATRRIENDEAYLLNLMRERGVTYSSAPQPMSAALRTTLITILSLWIPLSPLFWLMHRQLSGGNSLNQKRRVSSPTVNFEDVAGVDEAKVELVEIVSYLRGATNFRRLGAKLPKGVLLVGPPGTGKTLLARAVAGEAGVPFFAASASEFVEMFVGRGAARIRELFGGARKCSPSIIFIDELDAVGTRRGRSFNDERDQTLNQLLTEMDGFESETGVLVIAATNRPEALDPALCRPGRFSRKVFVREPDLKGRQQVLAVHMRGVPVEGDVEVVQSTVASITWGFVGADLANVVNEAALLAVREGRSAVTLEDFKAAVVRVKFGVGNKPAFSGAVGRVFGWLQPKTSKPAPSGYEAPSWSG